MKGTKKKNEKAITLIALVITIIVLLILAGVSIATLTGENGLLTKAQEAKEQNIVAKERDELGVAFNGVKIGKLGGEVTAEDLNKQFEVSKVKAQANGANPIKIVFEETGNEYEINDEVISGPKKGEGGSGEEKKELNIYTYEELVEFAKRVNNGENFKEYIVYLKNDISLPNEEWMVIGTQEKFFSGIFEGNGHTIEGLLLTNDTQTSLGLFSRNEGLIQNLNLKGKVEYKTDWHVSNGGIVGTNVGNITGCNVEINGMLESDAMSYESELGGIAGTNSGVIRNCKSSGKLEIGGKYVKVGGIAGLNYAQIEKCINEAEIVINEQGYITQSLEGIAGGIVGENRAKVLQNINKGKIRGYNYLLGGIVGKNVSEEAIIDECANWGNFETSFSKTSNRTYAPVIGGICSKNESGIIKNCYNIGNGIKNEEGNESAWSSMTGLVASNSKISKISNCYTIGEIPKSLDSKAAINVYSNDTGQYSNNYYNTETCISEDSIANGLVTAEMKNEDFISKLGESFKKDTEGINSGYPILKWQ